MDSLRLTFSIVLFGKKVPLIMFERESIKPLSINDTREIPERNWEAPIEVAPRKVVYTPERIAQLAKRSAAEFVPNILARTCHLCGVRVPAGQGYSHWPFGHKKMLCHHCQKELGLPVDLRAEPEVQHYD
jgi:hypothetical protein